MSKAVRRSPVLAKAVRFYVYDTSSAKTACSCMTCLISPDYKSASHLHLNSPLPSSSLQKRMSRLGRLSHEVKKRVRVASSDGTELCGHASESKIHRDFPSFPHAPAVPHNTLACSASLNPSFSFLALLANSELGHFSSG